jgi:hypothetical protein
MITRKAISPGLSGVREPFLAEWALEDGHVNPFAKLAPYLVLNPYQPKATAKVKLERGLVICDDMGDATMKSE